MPITPSTTIQVLILAGAIYVVMSFLRTARGSSLVRGLAFTLLAGAILFMWLSQRLELDVLAHMVSGAGPVAVVVLAILFQPELRRGVVHLGENPLLGRLLRVRREEVYTEIAQAVTNMANKRQGALIAFERKIPLDAFIESGVKVNADVNRFLLDSIFHHGSALHDGAVIVRGERIEAATSLFPLTENAEISKSTGTRHRAALGITEETDAVTLIVSEETGQISVCKNGRMEKDIPSSQVEERLRHTLSDEQTSDDSGNRRDLALRVTELFTRHAGQKIGALAIAAGLFWFTYQDLRSEFEVTLTVTTTSAKSESASPTAGTLQIVTPDVTETQKLHLAQPAEGEEITLIISGPRKQVEPLGGSISGTLHVGSDLETGIHEFELSSVLWTSGGSFIDGLEASWAEPPGPALEVQLIERERFTLRPQEHVVLNTDEHTPRYEPNLAEIQIEPSTVMIEGPRGSLAELETSLQLEPIVLTADDTTNRSDNVNLHPDLRARGFSLSDRENVKVTVPIQPAQVDLQTIEKEVSLVWLAADRASQLERWSPPNESAVFSISAAALMVETDANSSAWIEQATVIRQFVANNLQVFVDVSEIPDDTDRGTARVYWNWKRDWRDALPLNWVGDPRAQLEVELVSEEELLLNARP